jgi:hypothetical protein
MPGSTTLYAWTVPAFTTDSPVDHTWVTTYDNRTNAYQTVADVVAAGQFYWYCWGSFHPQGGTPTIPTGFLGSQSGDLALAQCLVQANAASTTMPAARGTIFVYGVDGVCHQLANQALYATTLGAVKPLTVRLARGYMASTFIYGTYGLQHTAWASKIAACSGTTLTVAAGLRGTAMAGGAGGPSGPDDFEERARDVLGPSDPRLQDLLRLRSEVQQFAAPAWPGTGQPSAEALNARNQHLLDEAAKLLGPDKFKEIFGMSPGEKIELVDKEINDSAGQIPPPRSR